MKTLLLFGAIVLSINSFAQNILWETTLGGSQDDRSFEIISTSDNGYLSVGFSKSTDVLVSANNGLADFWVTKLDSLGNLEWEKNYGGSDSEIANSACELSSGGYLILGNSKSNDIDVSNNYGGDDYWLIKIDAVGNIIWEKNFGGSLDDIGRKVIETSDNNIMIIGYSKSSDMDIPGNMGLEDCAILKLNSSGNIIWSQNYGANGWDRAEDIIEVSSGGYLITGQSSSEQYLLRLDNNGVVLWEQLHGGSSFDYGTEVIETFDGGYIVSGATYSSDGDVSNNYGDHDGWIVKTDSSGNIQWEKNYGGVGYDKSPFIAQTFDQKYIVGGFSWGAAGNDIWNAYGGADFWLMKLETNGNIIWSKNYGHGGENIMRSMIIDANEDIIVAGETWGSGDDISNSYGNYDKWIAKIGDSTSTLGFNSISLEFPNRERIMIIDFMGRETEFKANTPLIFIYSDGTRERVMKMEE
ncbi:hypothetical protein N9528_01225 [Crocinitomicaceae bacterium]|nr:hypothetical protein [Crocinitomicaceae bacterium]